ncbi:MAG: hypothetical protein K0U19_00995 [Proteobacteria bacterium]|nr:hypothetical protein [Pseudomonadota bacterium]
MSHLLRNALLLLTITLVALGNAVAQQSNNTPVNTEEQAEQQRAAAFYQHLLTHVFADDINYLSALMNYPLLYGDDDNRNSGKPSEIANAEEFVENYHHIFTPTIKRVLACRHADDFFTNSEGVMVGAGSLWFSLTYIGDDSTVRPIDYLDDPRYWQLKVVAVYDGAHARRDAEQCEAGQ